MSNFLGVDPDQIAETADIQEQAEKSNHIMSMLLENFGTDLVYGYSHYFATYIASWLSPLLLVLAIIYAMAVNQFQLITSSKGRTAEVLYNAIFYGLVLSLYFMLGFYAFEWFNALYGIGGDSGDLRALTSEMDRLYALIEERDDDIINDWSDIFKLPGFLVVWGFYYGSYLFLVAMIIMMRFAHAALFGVIYVWGTIAIPLSASMAWAPVGTWALMFTFVLFWPFVEGLMIMLISGMFSVGIERSFEGAPDASQISALFTYYSIFSVLNVVLIAVVVSAPAITSILLVRNEALGRALVPYMAAGLAIGKFFTDIARSRTMGLTNKGIDNSISTVKTGVTAGAAFTGSMLAGGGASGAAAAALGNANNLEANLNNDENGSGGLGASDNAASDVDTTQQVVETQDVDTSSSTDDTV